MSHGRHTTSSQIAHLVAEVRRMTAEEALEIHGIEINPDKTVYDTACEETFKNVYDWAADVVSQDEDEWEDEFGETGKWDDEE